MQNSIFFNEINYSSNYFVKITLTTNLLNQISVKKIVKSQVIIIYVNLDTLDIQVNNYSDEK